MPEQWFTYRQLADHWNTSPEAARARSRRGNYQRRTNNAGATEILVDTDTPVIEGRRRTQDGKVRTDVPPYGPNKESPPAITEMAFRAVLEHVETLKGEIAKVEARASQLQQERDVERERVADLTSQLLRITVELADARKIEAQPRGWLKRLIG
jgi:hypothetical protein